jgi:photosystem II stability/assembly factor-like uncharacterized protein
MPTRVIGLQFVDPRHGWLIGESTVGPNDARAFAMAASTDGGRTWRAIPIPPINAEYDWQPPGGLYFENGKDGWFYYRGLFVTHDGGLTWRDEKPEGTILRMDRAADGSSWAIEQDAHGWTLWQVSLEGYNQWQKEAMKFPIAMDKVGQAIGGGQLLPLAPISLVLADAQHAWLDYWDNGQPSLNNEHLLASADGGVTWRALHAPCSDYPANNGNLIALDQRHLWLGCGWPWGAGSGSKVVFASSDGGATWVVRGKGVLPSGDSLSTIGYFRAIGAVSTTFAYMTWDRTEEAVHTRDGGATWNYSQVPCSADSLRAVFIDPLHGWAFDQTCVNFTVDGGQNWDCTELPSNKPCLRGP